ncbi:Mucoidy inhibitor A [Frankia sp. Hr75.2]|nr:Mucoidy inhibitor A [Frankia sp. Hr75.2]
MMSTADGTPDLPDAPTGAPTGAPPSVLLDAPISAVVVYPTAARVTRRGRFDVATLGSPSERVEVTLSGLPLELDEDSVRVSGTGSARVLGVRVVSQARATPDAGALADLRARQAELRAHLAEIGDEDETERARRSFLDVAARVGAGALARGWAREGTDREGDGPGDAAARLVTVGDAFAAQMSAVHARRRALAERREETERELTVLGRVIEARHARPEPDTRAIVVDLEPPTATEGPAGSSAEAPAGGPAEGALVDGTASLVDLEVSYLVRSASWRSGYDARLDGERVTLTWFAMISQRTGEDWPVTDLRLSTARPSSGVDLPELSPQYVDIARPRVLPRGRAKASGEGRGGGGDGMTTFMPAAMAAPASAPPPMAAAEATLESAGPASTYRPPRPVAVPADGDPHRTTVAVIELDAVLDHVTVPKLAAEALLRAAVVNTSSHTLPPGKASVFHGPEFVGTTRLELVPPGGEMELRLGVDDRIRVERELVSRVTGRRVVGNTRRTDVVHRTTVTNHAPMRARVTVRDQVPVSRHENIQVREVVTAPAATEHTDLGLLTWELELEPGSSREITLSYRLEHPRGVEITGWGD